MGNLISVATHCQRGEEVILGSESHIYHYEQGGVSGECGCCSWWQSACLRASVRACPPPLLSLVRIYWDVSVHIARNVCVCYAP